MENLFIDFAQAISPALQTLLEGVLVILASQAVAWFHQKYQDQRAQLNERNQWALDFLINQSIRAAEQLYREGNGEAKKAYVYKIVEKELVARGLTIDLAVLDARIEAAVYAEFTKPTQTFIPPAVG